MKIIGQVTETEKQEIKKLYERINGLRELIISIDVNDNHIYEKLVNDMAITKSKFDTWWQQKSLAYNWEKSENGLWKIDFETNEILLENK